VIRDDLWTAAVAQLGDDDRRTIRDANSSTKLDVLSDLLQHTRKEVERCVGKEWRFQRKNGEAVIVRDLFGKIAKYINHFLALGDATTQFDSVFTALPWAGIRFLLQVGFLYLFEGLLLICRRPLSTTSKCTILCWRA
jgi:hypothetical protein